MSVTGPGGSFRRSIGVAVVPFDDGAYVCDLATHTPVTRITHSDSVDLATWIVEHDATRNQSA